MATFWDEIIEWGKEMLEMLEESVRTAWTYISRLPTAALKAIRYIKDGVLVERKDRFENVDILTDEDIDQMVPQPLSREQAEELKRNNRLYVQEMTR